MPTRIDPCLDYHRPVVVFDLDDTLYSEYTWALGGYAEVAREVNARYPQVAAALVEEAMTSALDGRRNPFDALEHLLGSRGLTCDTPRLLDAYRHHRNAIALYDDAAALLDLLRSRGIRMGLLTDGRSDTQRIKISQLGIGEFFHPADIVISEEIGADKLSPDGFIRFVHHYPEASRFCYVGDNPAKDFLQPEALGWTSIMLLDRDGRNIHGQEMHGEGRPDHVVSNLLEVEGIISL